MLKEDIHFLWSSVYIHSLILPMQDLFWGILNTEIVYMNADC